MNLTKSALIAFVAGVLFFSRAADAAPILQVNGNGILTGARNVDVGGVFYDVQFIDGSCVAIFSGCDSISDFTAFAAATDMAAQALLDQVFIGQFDTNPERTNGCSSTIVCNVYFPVGFFNNSLVLVKSATNFAGLTPDTVQLGVFGESPSMDTTELSSRVFANFQLSDSQPTTPTTPVPEPAALLLLSTGLAGVAAQVKKRQRQPTHVK